MLFNNVKVKVKSEKETIGSNYEAKQSSDTLAKMCFSITNEILSLRQHLFSDNHMDMYIKGKTANG